MNYNENVFNNIDSEEAAYWPKSPQPHILMMLKIG